MSSDTVYAAITIVRVTDIGLCLVNAYLVYHGVRHWRLHTAGNRFLWGGVGLTMLGVAYGQLEQVVERAPPGARSVFLAVALTYLMIGLLSKRRDPEKPPATIAP